MRAQTISVTIAAPPECVYAYAANPANLPAWVPSFCLSVAEVDGKWIVQSPDGPVVFSFAPRNDFAVLDHQVTLATGETFNNPMRVIANGGGSEVLFTLFQTEGMTDVAFAADAAQVRSDLETLRRILEGSG